MCASQRKECHHERAEWVIPENSEATQNREFCVGAVPERNSIASQITALACDAQTVVPAAPTQDTAAATTTAYGEHLDEVARLLDKDSEAANYTQTAYNNLRQPPSKKQKLGKGKSGSKCDDLTVVIA